MYPIRNQVGAWFSALPPDRRYLLAGVKAGWEVRVIVDKAEIG